MSIKYLSDFSLLSFNLDTFFILSVGTSLVVIAITFLLSTKFSRWGFEPDKSRKCEDDQYVEKSEGETHLKSEKAASHQRERIADALNTVRAGLTDEQLETEQQ